MERVISLSRAEFVSVCGHLLGKDPEGLLESVRREEFYWGPGRVDLATVPEVAAWYASVDAGEPDYAGCYGSPRSLAAAWFCWEKQARGHVRQYLRSVANVLPVPEVVLDAGGGVGLAAAVLSAELGSRAFVTNYPGSLHAEACRLVLRAQNAFGYTHRARPYASGREPRADLLLAFEYFEHFPEPIEELLRLLDRVKPTQIYLSNSFSVVAAGHFREYRVAGRSLPPRATQREFTEELRRRGFARSELIRAWNGKPQLWLKEGSE